MRAVIQRVKSAVVKINGRPNDSISKGLLIFLGLGHEDAEEDVEWLSRKIASLRIFNDEQGKMNLSLRDIDGKALVVSQFTLHASTRKGARPSFVKAAQPEKAIPLYEKFKKQLSRDLGSEVGSGEFGAMMEISLINDGPVTIWIDTRNKQ